MQLANRYTKKDNPRHAVVFVLSIFFFQHNRVFSPVVGNERPHPFFFFLLYGTRVAQSRWRQLLQQKTGRYITVNHRGISGPCQLAKETLRDVKELN